VKMSWLAVALTYVGAVVGAGFASGQEVYQFFGRFGTLGVAGLAVAGLLFGILGFFALERGRRGHATGFGDLYKQAYPPLVVTLAEGLTTAFLVIGLGVVASGAGATSAQMARLPPLVGAIGTIALVVVVVALGTDWVLKVNVGLIPYLVLLVLATAALSWTHPVVAVAPAPRGSWFFSALLYLSYNIFTGIMVLLGIGRRLRSARQSAMAAGSAALLLSLLALAEHHTLQTLETIGALPLVDVAFRLSPAWGALFGVCLWVALFTTGVAQAYALQQQFGRQSFWLVMATSVFGLIRFQDLVQRLYPIMGMVAVILWIPLVYRGPQRGDPGGKSRG
jgi:uncharacterized membrane protein YkvI